MASLAALDSKTFEAHIQAGIEAEIEKRIGALIDEAQEKLESEIRAGVAQIALNLLACYDISMDRDRVVISVKIKP